MTDASTTPAGKHPTAIRLITPQSTLQELAQHPAYCQLIINSIEFFKGSRSQISEPANTSAHTLIYTTAGNGYTERPDEPRAKNIFEKENFIIIPRGKQIFYGSESSWSIYRLLFSGNSSDSLTAKLTPKAENPCYLYGSHQTVITLFDRIINILQPTPRPENTALSSMLLWHLLACFIFRNSAISEAISPDPIEESIKYMEKNLNRELCLEELATVAGYSSSHYSTIFKEKTGEAPITYFINMKMHLAAEYLSLSSKSIKEISWLLGYSSQYYFSRLFKTHIGISPSEYREQDTTA